MKNKQKQLNSKKKKQVDAITKQNERLEMIKIKMIINKDDHKSIYRGIFDKVVKEKFVEIKELTHEIDHDDLMLFYYKNTPTKNLMILKMI